MNGFVTCRVFPVTVGNDMTPGLVIFFPGEAVKLAPFMNFFHMKQVETLALSTAGSGVARHQLIPSLGFLELKNHERLIKTCLHGTLYLFLYEDELQKPY